MCRHKWQKLTLRFVCAFALYLSSIFATAFPALGLTKPEFPVIFVHGIASDAGAWAAFGVFLSTNGWTFGGFPTFDPLGVTGVNRAADFYTMNFSDYNIADFPSQHLTLERQGMELDAIIQAVLAANPGKDKVILVAHSMGGLASRNYMQGLARSGTIPIPYRNNVLKLITVGTPHKGAKLADICSSTDLCLLLGYDPTSEAIALLRPDSAALTALNRLDLNPLPTEVQYVSIKGTGTTVNRRLRGWGWNCHGGFPGP